jgi:hypothetical protein
VEAVEAVEAVEENNAVIGPPYRNPFFVFRRHPFLE